MREENRNVQNGRPLHLCFMFRLQLSDASSDEHALPSEPSTASCGHGLRSHPLRRASAVGFDSLSVLDDAALLKMASAAAHTKAEAHAHADLAWRHRRGENARSSRSAGLLLPGTLCLGCSQLRGSSLRTNPLSSSGCVHGHERVNAVVLMVTTCQWRLLQAAHATQPQYGPH